MSSNIETLMQMKTIITKDDNLRVVNDAMITNPAKEVETSLLFFLKHRLDKLQESSDFEDVIKTTIINRLPEANLKDLMMLLDIIQRNNNDSTSRVLQPFISASGKTLTETIRDTADNKRPADAIYNNTEDKKVLQSIHAVQALLDKISALSPESGSQKTDDSTS